MTGPTASLASPADRPELEALRHRVFVEEQAVPVELERDELDEVATHAVARDAAGAVVGTGRMVVQPGGVARIGRMAVAVEARATGVGAAVLAVLEAAARAAGCRRVELHAQTPATGFYRRAGYAACAGHFEGRALRAGEVFDDAGLPHVAMGKDLF